jgi:hypothetical protein
MSSRAQSLNDESFIAPRLRKDQREKLRVLVRMNYEHPIIALGLVRDALKAYPTISRINDEGTGIEVIIQDTSEKMRTQYEFPFMGPVKIDPPTLD